MPDDAAGVRFTVLDPVEGPASPIESLDDGRLTDFYAYPDDLQACWVRGNMIASLDGGATDDGKAGGLAGPGDRAMFALMRQLADVILVGAGTVRIENYSGAQFSPAQRQARQRRGQAEVPPIAVVTNSGEFDHDAKLFTRTEVPPLILTSSRGGRRHPRQARIGRRGHRRVGPAPRPRRRRDGAEDPGRAQAVPGARPRVGRSFSAC